jgi:branched-chain amino acid transport system ATP-binding protein
VSDIQDNEASPHHINAGSRSNPVVAVQDLHVRIGSSHILQGISFEVFKGGVTAMLGRNGVGKTTCIKALLGIVRSEGRIALDGRLISGVLTHKIVRSGVGYVPEDREVFGGLTVEENLRLAERPGTVAHYDRVHELFPELKQRRMQLAGSLSGGQQQMVALARVLMNDTQLLLIDEPTKGLSPRLVEEVGDIIERIASHTTVVLVEQNLPLVRRIAQDAIVFDAGKVVYSGPARGLLDDAEATNRHLGVAMKGARS